MLPFTKQERLVLAFVCAVLFAGILLRHVMARWEFLNDFVEQAAEGKFK